MFRSLITTIALVILICSSALSQKVYTLKDLFTDTAITWYGIDYTRAEMVGTFGDKDLHNYFQGWNTLMLVETEKYNVAAALQRSKVNFDIASVSKLNSLSTPDIRFVPSDSALSKSDIAEMVGAYEEGKSEGIGIVFIAERYNKAKKQGVHIAVVFDIATKKVLISQRYTTAPDGIGVRNYWAPTIRSAIKLLTSNYKKWKKEHVNG
ncbi:hypothetical protein ACFQ21_28480 [Ohtaekwangia kribbensis]|uniref:Uncharacterized protein n=1 Tax=Ohtaekwangia kribbensis TaxID=688913 RepID=A0ABW3KCE3_9BACT